MTPMVLIKSVCSRDLCLLFQLFDSVRFRICDLSVDTHSSDQLMTIGNSTIGSDCGLPSFESAKNDFAARRRVTGMKQNQNVFLGIAHGPYTSSMAEQADVHSCW